MKTVIIKRTYYEYKELSDEGKEKAKLDYVNRDTRNEEFSCLCDSIIEREFPNSDLKVQYSLNYCQGDGLNVYGCLDFKDTLNKVKLTPKQKEQFEQMIRDYAPTYDMVCNHHYCYCLADRQEFVDNLYMDIDNSKDKGISKREEKLLDKIDKQLKEYFVNLCSEMEKDGYAYFNPSSVSDDEMEELSEINQWFYLEDGTLA